MTEDQLGEAVLELVCRSGLPAAAQHRALLRTLGDLQLVEARDFLREWQACEAVDREANFTTRVTQGERLARLFPQD